MRKFFLSFADSRMSGALQRIRQQAEAMGCYDHIVVADQSYLNIDFREKFKDKLKPNVRGYGYWCWKPQVILQLLDQIEDGDIIQYTDAGCHLNKNGKVRLAEYFQLAAQSDSGLLAFAAFPPSFHDPKIKLPDLSDGKWCKADLLDYFGVLNNKSIIETPSIGAGVIFIKKNKESTRIITEWMAIIDAHYNLLDDSPSLIKNRPEFIEHRHDQSVFSVLCKIYSVKTESGFEYWYPYKYLNYPNWHKLKNFPIHARRDRGLNLRGALLFYLSKLLSKLNKIILH